MGLLQIERLLLYNVYLEERLILSLIKTFNVTFSHSMSHIRSRIFSGCAGQDSPFTRHVSPRSEEITNWFVIDQYSDDTPMIRIMEAI